MTLRKRSIIALLTALVCLLSALTLPVGAALPQNSNIATARERIAASVGVDTPGAAVAIVEGGELIMLETVGYANISTRETVTPETVFEIGEASGLFVAMAVYRLVQEERLSLTADITRYLPDDVAKKLALSYPTTVEQLLLGSAGFEGRTFDLMFSKATYRFDSLKEALWAQVPRQIAAPGSFYAYSPFGIALAAYIVECVVQKPFDAYVTERFLTPLDMEHTWLNRDPDELPEDNAVGHALAGEGHFSALAGGGRSYAGLYPANGAVSSLIDLSRLLQFLVGEEESDILSCASRRAILQSRYRQDLFVLSAPAMSARGEAVGISGGTAHFGASLWLGSEGTAAVVLTNVAESSLLSLPATLCNATHGVVAASGSNLPDPEAFEGTYADTTGESSSFVGRFLRLGSNRQAELLEDGTLSFLDMRLTQIAPGVFAKADGDPEVAVVQFVLNADGEVERVVTADGQCYQSVDFFARRGPATLLLAVLVILSLWFVAAGLFALLRYSLRRYEEKEHEPFIFVLPVLFAGAIALCVFLQLLVGMKCGGAAFASFFGAVSVIIMFLCAGALVTFLISFMASLTKREMTTRVATMAILFLVFVFFVRYWGLLTL